MDSTNPRAADAAAPNRDQQTATNTLPTNSSTSTPQPASKPPIPPSPWAAQTTTFSATSSGSPSFPQFSAATAEILKRLQAHQGNATGTPAFEAKRAEVLQNYVTSDRLPTPPSIPASGRRGRGGKVGTPSGLKTEGTAGSAASTPASGRGSGRGRGRGRGGARGGKRKRAESVDSDVGCPFLSVLWPSRQLTRIRTTPTSLPHTHLYPPAQSLGVM